MFGISEGIGICCDLFRDPEKHNVNMGREGDLIALDPPHTVALSDLRVNGLKNVPFAGLSHHCNIVMNDLGYSMVYAHSTKRRSIRLIRL